MNFKLKSNVLLQNCLHSEHPGVKIAKRRIMSHGAENRECLNNPWLHNELLLLCCVINVSLYVLFTNVLGTTGFANFVPVNRICVVKSSCENATESPSDMPNRIQS